MNTNELQVARTKRAAIYVRMSTEHQDYSIANQTAALEQYAEDHGLQIVKRFLDPGRSGLTLRGRPGLKRLLLDVVSTEADFSHVLVYDVSRWGRFLDADESAYYEYTCKKANVKLHYCVEQFFNDGTAYSSLIKALKRTMAGEYSRELSLKVHAAQVRFAGMGFHQGGSPGYGLRRLLVDATAKAKWLLAPGERKGLQTDRVILVPGPAREVAVVRQIFKWFITERHSEGEIAKMLNRRKIKPERCGRYPDSATWTRARVHQILTCPRYVGTLVYNRTSSKLSGSSVHNPHSQWVLRDGSVKPIIDPQVFEKAQVIVKERLDFPSDFEILEQLSALLKKKGRLSAKLINKDPDTPCMTSITRRFKNLLVVYELIGYKPSQDCYGVARRRRERLRTQGVKSLGEGMCAALAAGRLQSTFTLQQLRVECPGWCNETYGSLCAHGIVRGEGTNSIELKRVGRAQYRVVRPQPERCLPQPARTQLNPQQAVR